MLIGPLLGEIWMANDKTRTKHAPGWWILKMTTMQGRSCVFRVREAKSNTNTNQRRDQGVFLTSWNGKQETHDRRTDSTTAMAGMWDRQRTDLVPRDHLPSATQKYLTSSLSHLVLGVLKKRWRVHESWNRGVKELHWWHDTSNAVTNSIRWSMKVTVMPQCPQKKNYLFQKKKKEGEGCFNAICLRPFVKGRNQSWKLCSFNMQHVAW